MGFLKCRKKEEKWCLEGASLRGSIPFNMFGIARTALYIIPLLFIKYPNSLKQTVTAELKKRREASGELLED